VAIALPFALWLGRYALRMSPRDIALALLSGLLLAADIVLWNASVLATSVMEATILVMLFPILVAAGEILFFRRRLERSLLLGGAVAFAGTGVIAMNASGGQSSLEGDLMAIVAAFFYAGSLLISGRLCQRNGARGVTVWVMFGAALGSLPLGIAEPATLPADVQGWAYLGLYGLLTFAGYALYNYALSVLPTTLVAISGYGQPLIATFLALLLLGELPSPGNLLGAGVIVAGLLLATLGPRPVRVDAEAKPPSSAESK
jgi:drug/metabolite transporter (DMT)-like permease